jgi:hypothetical protein
MQKWGKDSIKTEFLGGAQSTFVIRSRLFFEFKLSRVRTWKQVNIFFFDRCVYTAASKNHGDALQQQFRNDSRLLALIWKANARNTFPIILVFWTHLIRVFLCLLNTPRSPSEALQIKLQFSISIWLLYRPTFFMNFWLLFQFPIRATKIFVSAVSIFFLIFRCYFSNDDRKWVGSAVTVFLFKIFAHNFCHSNPNIILSFMYFELICLFQLFCFVNFWPSFQLTQQKHLF